jgi:predicted aspartyl protease
MIAVESSRTKFRLAGGAQPLILLPVSVNDQGPFQFILDTGAGTSLLSPELAQKIGATIIGAKQGQSAGGVVSVSLAKVHSLAVGEARRDEVDVGVVDLSDIASTIGAKIDGDLGYNFLNCFQITIDYHNCEMRFDAPKRVEFLGSAARAELPLRLAHPAKPLILVDAYLNRQGPFQFAIDTGTSTTAITPELARKLRVVTSPIGAATTGGAKVEVVAGFVRSFALGAAQVDNMAVVVADFFAMLSSAVGTNLDGIVGYNFLRNYKVVIDYPGEVLRLF